MNSSDYRKKNQQQNSRKYLENILQNINQIKYQYCQQKEHQGLQIQSICVYQNCQRRFELCCIDCVDDFHFNHDQSQILSLNKLKKNIQGNEAVLLEQINFSLDKQNDPISQQKQFLMQSVQNVQQDQMNTYGQLLQQFQSLSNQDFEYNNLPIIFKEINNKDCLVQALQNFCQHNLLDFHNMSVQFDQIQIDKNISDQIGVLNQNLKQFFDLQDEILKNFYNIYEDLVKQQQHIIQQKQMEENRLHQKDQKEEDEKAKNQSKKSFQKLERIKSREIKIQDYIQEKINPSINLDNYDDLKIKHQFDKEQKILEYSRFLKPHINFRWNMATEGKKTCDMIKFQLNNHLENKSVVLLGIRQNKVMNWMQNEKVSLNFRMKAENLPWDPADLLLDDNFEIDKNTVIRGNMIDVYFQNPIKVFPNSKYILACMCESKWWQAFSGGCKKTQNEKSENQIENEKEPFLFFETKQNEAPEDFKLNNTNLENGQLHTFIYAIEQE